MTCSYWVPGISSVGCRCPSWYLACWEPPSSHWKVQQWAPCLSCSGPWVLVVFAEIEFRPVILFCELCWSWIQAKVRFCRQFFYEKSAVQPWLCHCQVNIIRNVLPIVTFILEKILFNSPRLVKPGHILSMVLTLFGTTLYGISNFSVTTWSLVMILLGRLAGQGPKDEDKDDENDPDDVFIDDG